MNFKSFSGIDGMGLWKKKKVFAHQIVANLAFGHLSFGLLAFNTMQHFVIRSFGILPCTTIEKLVYAVKLKLVVFGCVSSTKIELNQAKQNRFSRKNV